MAIYFLLFILTLGCGGEKSDSNINNNTKEVPEESADGKVASSNVGGDAAKDKEDVGKVKIEGVDEKTIVTEEEKISPEISASEGISTSSNTSFAANKDDIYFLASLGKVEEMNKLLEQGLDINIRDEHNFTLLHHAVINSKLDMVDFLFAKGASAKPIDPPNGAIGVTTILHFAALNCDAEIIKSIIKVGEMNVNAPNEMGETPLLTIFEKEEIDDEKREYALDVLLREGAKIDVKSMNGTTPISKSIEKGEKNLFKKMLLSSQSKQVPIEYYEVLKKKAEKLDQEQMLNMIDEKISSLING